MKILIDPGHGIDTPGKRSPDGLFREYLWNRQVADLILEGLLSAGVDASLVVTETNDVTLRNRVNRVNTICNRVGASNVLLVSIHANAAGNGSAWMNAKGWSCYTSKGKTKSDQVAECLYDAFEEEFQDRKIRKDMSDGDRDWEENFYVLQKSKCAAVLLENFFYDNREECAWMLQEETKRRIAGAAVKGIIKYIKK
ncbi:MAG: N-acetylmuramoyl-L-alanine amidase [Prevotella sp.]|nr:N-acetylmuramoyl-L-alanine amidase [Prevotella sp.]